MHIFFFLLLAFDIAGQGSRQYSFTHYGVSSGLASNEAITSLQDEQGFIWIATNNGLQRFDGQRYLGFRHQKNNPSSIPHNYIVQLLLDKKKNLWILTNDGKVGIFDTKKFIYQEIKVTVKNIKVLTIERELIEDLQGNLFLLFHHNELATWNEKHREFSAAYNFIVFPPDWGASDCIQQPGTEKYWIGGNKGLAVYDRKTNELSYKGHNAAREAIIDKFGHIPGPSRLLIDKRNRLWFGAWLGSPTIFACDMKNGEPVLDRYDLVSTIDGYHELRGFLEQQDGTIWIKGLNIFARYQEKEKKFVPVYNGYIGEQSIDYDKVNDLFEDRDQNIWVTTNNNGLYSFNPSEQFFSNVRPINRNTKLPIKGSIMSIILTKQRTLLAGTWGDGLYRYDSNYRMVPLNIRGIDEKNSPWIWGMCLSADSNTIWMGAQPGVYAVNQTTQSASYYNPAIMQNKTVRQVAADKYGNLWMGTQSLGLFKWRADNSQPKFEDGVKMFTTIPVNQIAKLFICNRGYVWVGTSDFGLYVIDPATDKVVYHFGTKEPAERKLTRDAITSVMQYDDTTIVIAANGLHFFNTKKERLIKSISLPESNTGNMAAMEKDKNGYIWLSMTNGIFRLNPNNKIFIHFDRVDGIINDHFVIASSIRLPSGRIAFGGDNQFVIFDPLKVTIN
ncbi:MAG: ligand-binding sensor domain-containing protein, partial [Chitinophagaceae bacterium]